ncbi:hypothetical protein [Massilia sp. 9096]|uniref:hypothetical protein n=1 Tax=Massilia sp. 9096 TaxID=1500894 RepID=UPI0012E02C56|nr:hypothetical protein [Massilia sp. 9096]
MYTFIIGVLKVTSSSATIQVFSPGDWLDNADASVWKNVEVTQDFMAGCDAETAKSRRLNGPDYPRLLDVSISNAVDLARYSETIHSGTKRFFNAMRVAGYECGELVELSRSALGYAPGGISYFLLPHDLPCVDLRCLKLDWGSVIVQLEDNEITHNSLAQVQS